MITPNSQSIVRLPCPIHDDDSGQRRAKNNANRWSRCSAQRVDHNDGYQQRTTASCSAAQQCSALVLTEEATAKRPACTPPTPPPAWSSTDSSHPTAHRRPPRHPHTMARDAPCRNNIRSTKPSPPTGGPSLVGAARRLSRCRAERQITASVGSDGSEQRRRTDHPSHRRCTRTPTNRTCHTDTSSPTNILISGADCARKVLTAICSRDATSSARWNIVAAR